MLPKSAAMCEYTTTPTLGRVRERDSSASWPTQLSVLRWPTVNGPSAARAPVKGTDSTSGAV
jgi:hypothetical protein